MGVPNNTEWTECNLFLNAEWYKNETEKAWVFNLWNKRRMVFPKKLIQRFQRTRQTFVITMPKWFVAEHDLKYLMDKEVRLLLFPAKRRNNTKKLFDTEQVEKPKSVTRDNLSPVPKPDSLPKWW
jgi:hypothetical protein